MNILLVGALSWNPERVIALSDNGHRLFGLWSRTMGWEQGPYAFAGDAITDVDIEGAIDLLSNRTIDIVYSLFQVYDPELWAPQATSGADDVWIHLRQLLAARRNGTFDAPIVRHWGFDILNLDLDVVRALDGQIFCNRHKLRYWTKPRKAGGCGLDLGLQEQEVAFMDSDLPLREFMNDRFTQKLSARDGEIHTVCVGRPLGIDFLSAARHRIHVHVYGNNFNDVVERIAWELFPKGLRNLPRLIADYLHVHPSLQPGNLPLQAIRSTKDRWVEEFSRYDAGWSYVGRPQPWPPLEDEGAIPNRLGTYLLAGLPIIAERLPGYYRYDTIAECGIAIDFEPKNYARLAAALRRSDELNRMNETARHIRRRFSFDEAIDSLIEFFERVIKRRRGRPCLSAPVRNIGRPRMVQLYSRPVSFRRFFKKHAGPGGLRVWIDALVQRARRHARSLVSRVWAADFVSQTLKRSSVERPQTGKQGAPPPHVDNC